MSLKINPKLDLVLERIVDVPADKIWRGWTVPENIEKWFCPKPYEVTHSEIDLRAGGIFRTDMKGPDLPESPNTGCILEVIPNKKFVWTSALMPDYQPSPIAENNPGIFFTGVILLEEMNGKTKYTAIAMHPDEKTASMHAQMGFQEGWGICLDQLVEEIKKGNIK